MVNQRLMTPVSQRPAIARGCVCGQYSHKGWTVACSGCTQCASTICLQRAHRAKKSRLQRGRCAACRIKISRARAAARPQGRREVAPPEIPPEGKARSASNTRAPPRIRSLYPISARERHAPAPRLAMLEGRPARLALHRPATVGPCPRRASARPPRIRGLCSRRDLHPTARHKWASSPDRAACAGSPAPGAATDSHPDSSARAEASRKNGARSRDPKTPDGRARSPQNALLTERGGDCPRHSRVRSGCRSSRFRLACRAS
jgi:hypothetical protein